MSLTMQTQIPTSARGAVRSLVKAHPAWQAFITSKGKMSAQALNAELLEFALMHATLTAQIESLLSLHDLDVDGHVTMGPGETFEDCVEQNEANFEAVPATAGATAYDFATLISPVEQLLSPLVRKEIEGVLTPVIDAANRGPVEKIVEIERIVEVAAGEGPRLPAAPKARRDKRVPVRTVISSRAKDAYLDAPLTLWTGAPSPAVDPFYVVVRSQMALLLTAIERGTNVWLTGHAGTGKSTMAEHAAALTGRPFVKIGMTRQTEVESLVGGMGLRNGATIWEDGVLVKAMRAPGTVILIDELTFAPAGVQAIIQLVADDHKSLTLPTGEVVRCADGVVFIVADNTNGTGDEGGLYAGTNVSNAALVTRFKRMIFVDYLTAQQEAEALANHTACPLPAAKHLADFVATCRRLPTLQGVVISIRQMVGFVQCVQDGFSSKDAFAVTISSRMPATERATIEASADLAWNSTFEALVHNKPVPATPSNSAAAQAFADTQY